ncbi:MAG: DUF2835 domain-containing protein [Gammaproteobacteria bacterium]|nr:DUF2835 domain-containing protein [Gammaproteobacteria bacterium]
MTSKVYFSLNISHQDYLAHYQGAIQWVIVRAHDGRKVQFPASLLRQFVGHDGVHGAFEIQFDDNFKFQSMRRLR